MHETVTGRVPTQQTYHGKTGGGLIATAQISQTQAGTWEIWIDGMVAELSDYDELVLADTGGIQAVISLSPRAIAVMRGLQAKRERAYADGVSAVMRSLRAIPSARRAEASRANGRRGGRPRTRPR